MTSNKILVIVESPGKISKIKQYLGDKYIIKASLGHIHDLDKNTLSIEVENNFNPLYKIIPTKMKIVKELKECASYCSDIILASDGDREGEAIAYSLATILKLKDPKRIIFHEITKSALLKAIENPQTINYNMVHSQQARRLLDRLVGYKISPVLWKNIDGNTQSAGRVQSVVVKIIIDKENEIKNASSEIYYKTNGYFIFDSNKLNSILYQDNNQYHFDSEDNILNFLNKINKNVIFKIVNIDNKISIRKPPIPFITSSLQQEASTKLKFNVKKTMDVAQKLYEAGLITYMRTDCPNISQDAINKIEKYIKEKYGNEYSEPKNYQSKNANSQDAHECIRPTDINKTEIDMATDYKKLYSLIWKRTIASQMTSAKLNIQTVLIDAQINNNSILIINEKQLYFNTSFEHIEFPGFLIIYDSQCDINNEESEENKNANKINFKINDILKLDKIKIIQEYTKLPLRYNEALLVKYLEKNGIGRPSTYASIISKVIDRGYVEIKNIDGISKESKEFELNNKFKIKENIKSIIIGKEQKKIVPTETGIKVNEFLVKHFSEILEIDFTALFESYLDKISIGKANWITVLQTFYDKFNPIVISLNKQEIIKHDNDILLGLDKDHKEIYKGKGKYGPYVKIKDDNKWKYASIKDIDNISLVEAIYLLSFPRKIGKIGNAIVSINNGIYGIYIKYLNKNYSVKDVDINKINIDYVKKLIK